MAIAFFGTKIRMVLSLAKVGQPHRTQPRAMENSARGSLQTQNRGADATEGVDGSLLRDPGCSGSCPEGLGVPSTCWGGRGTPQFILCLSLQPRGSENQFSALMHSCRPGPTESLLQERWMGCLGCCATCCDELSKDHPQGKVFPGTAELVL